MIAIFPEIISTAKQRDIELLAIQVRRYFAGDAVYQPKLDLSAILHTVGIKVDRMPLEEDAVLCVRDVAGSFEVVAIVNEQVNDEVQARFLMAHLLGHFLLHVQPHIAEGSWKTSGLRELISPLHRYSRALHSAANDDHQERIEREADEFAAALLLPIGMLKRAAVKISATAQLAAFFGTAESVVRRRLDDIQGAGDQPGNFVDAESKIMREANQERSTPRTKEVLYSEKQKPEAIRMPRSVAANSYRSMKTRTDSAEAQSASVSEKNAEETSPLPGDDKPKGMARIRELAKQLDKSVPADPKG